MAVREFKLPDPGEGLVEADIVTWRVAVGDTVKVNDILLEIETSKSLVELPSPYAGTVTALLVAEGTTADVGSPIIAIEDGAIDDQVGPVGTDSEQAVEPSDGMSGGGDGGKRVPNLVGYGPSTGASSRRPRKGRTGDPAPQQVHDELSSTFATDVPVSRRADGREPLHASTSPATSRPAAPLPGPGSTAPEPALTGGAVLAKPPVRKLAKDLGIDFATLTGSGPGGVITRDDVATAAAPEPQTPESPTPATSGDVRIPIRGVRKATAEAMVRSAFTAPHVTEWLTCDVTQTMELVDRLKARREFREVRISPLLIVAKAVCLALGRTPELNSFWDEPAGEIVQLGSVNLGIAANTPRGLVVPNIKNAQTLPLLELAQAINALVSTAREGRTTSAEMAGGSFTITNVGTFGVDAGTPILNPGESGILCLGQVTRRPWVVGSPSTGSGNGNGNGNGNGDGDERIEPRWVTTLAVSFDHRLADGAQGSTFLAAVAQILTDPGLGLLY